MNKMNIKKVGYVFGSFDPLHIGHISIATQALNDNIVDYVRFVPTKQNPWKKRSNDFNIRCEMLYKTLKYIDNVWFTDIENYVDLQFTFDVLEAIEEELKQLNRNEKICILTTQETYDEIPNWYKGKEILEKYEIHVVNMPIKIHSTDVRNMIKDNKNPYPYITKEVYDIIKEEGLYGMASDE